MQQRRSLNLPLQVLLFLRVGQTACTTLTIYATMFYLGFYVWYRKQQAPGAEYFILFTCFLSVLEAYFTTAYTIFTCCTAEFPRLDYRLLLLTSSTTTILSWRAYSWLRQVPWLRFFNEGNNNGIYYYRDSVERGTCAINDLIIVAGGLMVLFTALIAVWAAWGLWYEKRHAQGAIRLDDENVDDGHPDGVSEKYIVE